MTRRWRVLTGVIVLLCLIVIGAVWYVATQTQSPATPKLLTPRSDVQPVMVQQSNDEPPHAGFDRTAFDLTLTFRRLPDQPHRVTSPDGALVVVWWHDLGDTNLNVHVVDTADVIFEASNAAFYISDVAFNPASDMLVLAGMDKAGRKAARVDVVDLPTGEVWTLDISHATYVAEIAGGVRFSHHGTRIIFGLSSGDSCSRLQLYPPQIWDVTTQHPVPLAVPFAAISFAFSPDDQFLALGSAGGFCGGYPGILQMLDMDSGKVMFRGDLPTDGVTFSPDGRYLLSVDGETYDGPGLLYLWDAETGTALGTYSVAYESYVWEVAARFEDTRLIVTYHDDAHTYTGEILLP